MQRRDSPCGKRRLRRVRKTLAVKRHKENTKTQALLERHRINAELRKVKILSQSKQHVVWTPALSASSLFVFPYVQNIHYYKCSLVVLYQPNGDRRKKSCQPTQSVAWTWRRPWWICSKTVDRQKVLSASYDSKFQFCAITNPETLIENIKKEQERKRRRQR